MSRRRPNFSFIFIFASFSIIFHSLAAPRVHSGLLTTGVNSSQARWRCRSERRCALPPPTQCARTVERQAASRPSVPRAKLRAPVPPCDHQGVLCLVTAHWKREREKKYPTLSYSYLTHCCSDLKCFISNHSCSISAFKESELKDWMAVGVVVVVEAVELVRCANDDDGSVAKNTLHYIHTNTFLHFTCGYFPFKSTFQFLNS